MRYTGVNITQPIQSVPSPTRPIRFYPDAEGGCMVTLHGVYCSYITPERFAVSDIRTEPGTYRAEHPSQGPIIRVA